jgi:hypothetical protein
MIPGEHPDTRINCFAGQLSYSHLSAWCVGGLAPFMINITHFRIKPLPLTMAVTPERSEVKPPPGSRIGLKYPLELLENSIHDSFSRRRRRSNLN